MEDKSTDLDADDGGGDICRVCRTESSPDRQLYHPCLCTGSIKYIHQECLTQWLKYSKKEYCELCNYKYTFKPIYHPDMPKRLPVKDLVQGLLKSLWHGVRFWIHYTLVAIAWLGIVPLSACRIYRCLFTGSMHSLLSLSLDMFSTENLFTDCLHGAVIIIITLCAFICLVWLREQIVHGGLPGWMEPPAPVGMVPPANLVPPDNEDLGEDLESDDDDDDDDDDDEGSDVTEYTLGEDYEDNFHYADSINDLAKDNLEGMVNDDRNKSPPTIGMAPPSDLSDVVPSTSDAPHHKLPGLPTPPDSPAIVAGDVGASSLPSTSTSKSSSLLSIGFMKSAFSSMSTDSGDGSKTNVRDKLEKQDHGKDRNIVGLNDFRSISADGIESQSPYTSAFRKANEVDEFNWRFRSESTAAEGSRSDGEEEDFTAQEPSTSALSLPDLSQYAVDVENVRNPVGSFSNLLSLWSEVFVDREPGDDNDEIGDENQAEGNVEPAPELPDILEPLEPDVLPGAPDEAQNQADDENWQPFEWNQAGEDLTWERLLGIDGSLAFLEHVFWVISLNTLFILVFAFSPFHIGNFAVVGFQLMPYVQATYFEGVVTTLVGYFLTAMALYISYVLFRAARITRVYRAIGMCYLAVKVFLLVLLDIGVFPLMCGWWLDICSLNLFAAALKDRVASFHLSPPTSMFMHWIVGMVYVFYFASFILLMREVLRPGVLWFLRNLNDPDFNPIHEMLQHPVHRHVRRFLCSSVLFCAIILLLVYVPLQLIAKIWVGVLPYKISLNMDTPLTELSLELLLLQVVLPALLEQSQARQFMKTIARAWCRVIGRVLGLTEYLLPIEDIPRPPQNATENPEGNDNAADLKDANAASDATNDVPTSADDQGHSLPSTSQQISNESTSEKFSNETGINNENVKQKPGLLLVKLLESNQKDARTRFNEPIEDTDRTVVGRTDLPDIASPSTSAGESGDCGNNDASSSHYDSTDRTDIALASKSDELADVDRDVVELNGAVDNANGNVDNGGDNANNDNNGNNNINNNNNNNDNNDNANLAAAHQALLLGHGPLGIQPYRKPSYFVVRICLLLVSMSLSLMLGSLLALTVPVLWGRGVIHVLTGRQTTHELYTIACGLYLSWLVMRGVATVVEWVPKGWQHVWKLVVYWSTLVFKCTLVGFPLLVIVPLAMGVLFQLIVVTPLRVPINQSPVLFPTQDWALGILHCKICCAAVMMGPDWWLKTACEQFYRDGVRNLNLAAVYKNLIIPVCSILGLVLAVPYVFAHTAMALYGYHLENQVLFVRHAYPCMLIVCGAVGFVVWHLKQLSRLVDHIRNDKYLVHERLVNYVRPETPSRDNSLELRLSPRTQA